MAFTCFERHLFIFYNNAYWISSYDLLINVCSMNILIPFLSFILLYRVMKQQTFKWRRGRKMLIQLLSISFLYILFLVTE
jgi:hypothetical protein